MIKQRHRSIIHEGPKMTEQGTDHTPTSAGEWPSRAIDHRPTRAREWPSQGIHLRGVENDQAGPLIIDLSGAENGCLIGSTMAYSVKFAQWAWSTVSTPSIRSVPHAIEFIPPVIKSVLLSQTFGPVPELIITQISMMQVLTGGSEKKNLFSSYRSDGTLTFLPCNQASRQDVSLVSPCFKMPPFVKLGKR